MKSILLLGFCLYTLNGFCVDCKSLSKAEEYKYSDLIFIGTVTGEEERHYTVDVEEMFKGEVSTSITIHREQSPRMNKGEQWLIYALQRGDSIFIDPCSGSKSFTWPYGLHDINRVEVPPSYFNNKSMSYILETVWDKAALSEFYYDIIGLRQLKTQQDIVAILETNKQLSDQYTGIRDQYRILLGAFILSMALTVVFGLVVLKKVNKKY